MVDVVRRKALAEVLIRCLDGKANWRDLDTFLGTPVSQNAPCDEAILGIGYEFWENLDPEYPENRIFVRYPLVFRTLLFLNTEQEYVCESEPVWVVLRPLLLLLSLFTVVCCVFLKFKVPFYWLFIVLLFGALANAFAWSIINKPKPPSPDEEAKAFWPFESWEAYQTAKRESGEHIQKIVDCFSMGWGYCVHIRSNRNE